MKYSYLINKKINIKLDGKIMNSYTITKMNPVGRYDEHLGFLYACTVEWDKKMEDDCPRMDFDEKTLDDLVNNGFSISPIMDNMSFVIEKQLN